MLVHHYTARRGRDWHGEFKALCTDKYTEGECYRDKDAPTESGTGNFTTSIKWVTCKACLEKLRVIYQNKVNLILTKLSLESPVNAGPLMTREEKDMHDADKCL